MTLPASVYELPKLDAAIIAQGREPAETYRCPKCRFKGSADSFVSTTELNCDLPGFVCTDCASTPFRHAKAQEEAEALEAAGPDWTDVRAERSIRLTLCDWTQVPDTPLSDEQRSAWAAYRTALRNITTTFPDPASVVWPDAPS